jgi:hypothetical protein
MLSRQAKNANSFFFFFAFLTDPLILQRLMGSKEVYPCRQHPQLLAAQFLRFPLLCGHGNRASSSHFCASQNPVWSRHTAFSSFLPLLQNT